MDMKSVFAKKSGLELDLQLECRSVFAFESAITRRPSRGVGG